MKDAIIEESCKTVEEKYIITSKNKLPTLQPILAVLVSDDMTEAELSYLRQLERKGKEYGCVVSARCLSLLEAKQFVTLQAACPVVDGILVLSDFDGCAEQITNLIPRHLDVDGSGLEAAGWLYGNDSADWFLVAPSTASAVILVLQETLDRLCDSLCGKKVAIINRSKRVGRPLAKLLTDRDATVTMLHSKSDLPKDGFKNFDIVCSAVGKPKFFTPKNVDGGLILIDVGINVDKNGNLCGDFDYENLKNGATYITPVPGGIGKLTTTCTFAKVFHHAVFKRGFE